ncbi:casein kinase I [Lepeophtheirus salmonis]|uniref:casein kinase I n=1 Tax=Lepeophtheirus salmonis TaxID=72036 RepID=UPI001AE65E37|nr:casein kinase I-like [Lepeophtheirus salmonis]
MENRGNSVSPNGTINLESTSKVVVGKKFRLIRKIGSGSFGNIYLGKSEDNETEVAIKTEPKDSLHPQLYHESRVYSLFEKGSGFPKVYWYGSNKKYNFLVLDLLGNSLEELFDLCSRSFSIKTILMIGDQMIDRIKYVHSKNYIHRDIKPDNFLIGLGTNEKNIYLVDYGLAKKYRDSHTHVHNPFRKGRQLSGTARYASTNAHSGIEQSRRDDMESLGYLLIYFNRGHLPWQNMKASTIKQRHEKIAEKKMSTPLEVLCQGYPSEFRVFLEYCRKLGYSEEPDYQYLSTLLRSLSENLKYTYDWIFDWTGMDKSILKDKQKIRKNLKMSKHN